MRATYRTQRQAVVIGGDGPALDGCRNARGRRAISQGHLLPATRKAGHRDRARSGALHNPQGGRYARACLTITPGPPSPSSTTRGTSSPGAGLVVRPTPESTGTTTTGFFRRVTAFAPSRTG